MAKSKAKPASKTPFVAEEPAPAWPHANDAQEKPLTEAEKDAMDWEIIKNDDPNVFYPAREVLAQLRAEREKRSARSKSASASKGSKT